MLKADNLVRKQAALESHCLSHDLVEMLAKGISTKGNS